MKPKSVEEFPYTLFDEALPNQTISSTSQIRITELFMSHYIPLQYCRFCSVEYSRKLKYTSWLDFIIIAFCWEYIILFSVHWKKNYTIYNARWKNSKQTNQTVIQSISQSIAQSLCQLLTQSLNHLVQTRGRRPAVGMCAHAVIVWQQLQVSCREWHICKCDFQLCVPSRGVIQTLWSYGPPFALGFRRRSHNSLSHVLHRAASVHYGM